MAEQSSGKAAERTGLEVAVVGMAGRFPGAGDIHAFWRNLRGGVESIARFTRQELLDDGYDPAMVDHPDFVPARGHLHDADEIDAGLFNLTPRDAELLNPQHRVLLECAWAALEHAGHDPARIGRPVGVFAGCGTNTYLLRLAGDPERVRTMGMTRISLGNEKDQLAAEVSYRLDLQGPSMAVQTACSTSLVAVHVACQSLINGECDLALAGGVSIPVPLRGGYVYAAGGILSPDGRCRAFDAESRGAVGGSGAGLVALRRLEDALADGDTIHAVIRGSAVNNDGAQKAGYTAPSVGGQSRVIAEALSVANVDAATLQYVETHGTGTPLGDAIEIKAMSQVLAGAGGRHPCAIGSVKTNVGHLDAAAGVAGLIKTVLALEHAELPPSLNCATPHPQIAESGGHVFVNTALRPWERNGTPRRAGVSSFGLGGTNAHVVLEEAPPRGPSGDSRELQLLVVSAKTPTALAAAAANLADHLEREPTPLADAAYTLQTGRRELEHRLAVVARDAAEAAGRLREAAAKAAQPAPRGGRPVAFMFPGLGTHYAGMGRGLYDAEPAFRAAVDECCELLRPVLGADLREALFPPSSTEEWGDGRRRGGGWDLRAMLSGARGGEGDADSSALDDTRLAQPAVFVIEYALARLWMSWGVRPRAMVGHSLGEYVAACVAGVLRLEDALKLVALRAKLIDALPPGAMLAVPLAEAALREILPDTLDVAAVNTRESCVVAGPADEVEAFEAALAQRGTVSRRLATRHAFHSRAMGDVAAELERLVAGFELRAPEIPFVSNVTGTWITGDEARSPEYWARHLCGTVRFADGVATLRAEPGLALLEVGPGQTLGAWAMQHPGAAHGGHVVLSSLRHQHNRVGDTRFVLDTLGRLWAAGVAVDWTAFGRGERRHRVPLPTYPFERRRYWVDAPKKQIAVEAGRSADGASSTGGWANGASASGTSSNGTSSNGKMGDAVHENGNGRGDTSHQKGPDVMENRLAALQEPPVPPRYDAILERLAGLAAELTGIDREQVLTDVDFFEAGIDSLLLLQAIQAIEKRMGVKVSLAELLEDTTTLEALARYMDRALPPEFVLNGHHPEPPMAGAPAEPARASIPIPPAFYPPAADLQPKNGTQGESWIERLFARQLEVIEQQIAVVRGGAFASGPVAAGGETIPAPISAPPVARPAQSAASPASPAAGADEPARAKIQPETFVPFKPLPTQGGRAMPPEQQAYLDDFIRGYLERTRGSRDHQARYHVPLADGRVTARFRRPWKEIIYPIVVRNGRGSRMWDVDGNEYVDVGMGFGCNLFGHAPDFVTAAIQRSVESGYVVGPQSPAAGRAAELVCELGGNDRAVFCNSGTEAVMGAIRAARTFTGRTRIAYFAGSYHGWSDVVLGRAVGRGAAREVHPLAPGIPELPLRDALMLDWDDPASLDLLAEHIDEIAVVLAEPVQSRRLDVQPRAFLHRLRELTRERGTLLLFDELITGFRILPGGAQAYFGVQADLVTYGKVVAGGLPMGVVAGRRDVMAVFDGGVWSYGDDSYPTSQRTFFAGAFFKHPLSMEVAVAVLEEVKRQGPAMYERLNARTTALVERMNAFFEAERFPINAVHFGSVFRFFFGPEVPAADLFNHHLILEGVHVILETGTCFVSTAHTDADLERVFQAVCAAARAMRRGGLIPPAPGGDASPTPETEDGGAGEAEARVLPLTEGQRQLWLESQMGDEAALAYVESCAIRLRGALDAGALRRSLQTLVARHDTLRVTFSADGESQVVHPAPAVELPLVDFRGVPDAGRAARVDEWVRRTVQRPFDLVAGPLARFDLAAVGEDEHLLLITTHHATLDGWSYGVVIRELAELYAAACAGRAAELPDAPPYGRLVRERIDTQRQATEAAEAFWAAQFADGVPVLDLPTDRPRPPVRGYAGGRVRRELRDGLMDGLAAVGREHGFTLFNLLLSALYVWLGRVAAQDDVVVGVPSAGQAAPGAAELVGYGINVLPLRARLEPELPFVELAKRVRKAMLRGLAHQDFSFPRLVERLLHGRDASRLPLYAVTMNLDRAGEPFIMGGLRAEFETVFGGGAKMDLRFDITEAADGLRVDCVYAASLFERETIERWLASFERLLADVAEHPDRPLGELEMVPDDELGEMVDAFCDAALSG